MRLANRGEPVPGLFDLEPDGGLPDCANRVTIPTGTHRTRPLQGHVAPEVESVTPTRREGPTPWIGEPRVTFGGLLDCPLTLPSRPSHGKGSGRRVRGGGTGGAGGR